MRASNPGKEPLLNDVQQAQLHQVLTNPARDEGLWADIEVWCEDEHRLGLQMTV